MTKYAQITSDDIDVGDRIAPVTLDITYRRMIVNVASSWDLFAGHYEPEYARAHGHPTVFANTSLFLGFVDRVITDWSGPRTRIARRKLSMRRPIYAGDTMHGEGSVVAIHSDNGIHLVDLELTVSNGRDVCATAQATIEIPTSERNSA